MEYDPGIYAYSRNELTAINSTTDLQGILLKQFMGMFVTLDNRIPLESKEQEEGFTALLEDIFCPERRQYESPIEAALFA
jgi:hypothetical protein